jgi:TolB-like protein
VWLIDVRQGVQIWSDIYEGRITDAVPAQIDISSMISADVIERIASAPASACPQ